MLLGCVHVWSWCAFVCCLLCELGTSSSRWFRWPCRAGKEGIPPSQTPHIDTSGMYFTLELHVLYNYFCYFPPFSVFSITEG